MKDKFPFLRVYTVNLHNLPIYSSVRKLKSVRLLYNFTGFEFVPVFVTVRRIDAKKEIWETAEFLYSVLCHFSVAIKELSSPNG